ncbi:FUSC family protein [Zhihengliuella flava]|uniref:Integral membrane bound transporter domain-containing protein n=1 Tax=Zhihengliuella flava TaxID=1285193 RepID=A0A931D7L3_9MICC|nr:FUSC family protein [Zhihengliuella flava]MBG6085150.1 hypothetical protein [Zhihengliuella flava]
MDDPLHWKKLFTLGPAQRDHRAALRASCGVFLPLLVLLSLDRIDLALFAVFAAFTNIYGRGPSFALRWRAQLRGGGLMWLVMVAAVATQAFLEAGTEAGRWAVIGVTTLISGTCALAVGWLRIRPAGSLFHIFAFAAIATLPASINPVEALTTATATFLLGLGIGQFGRWWQRPAHRERAVAQPKPFAQAMAPGEWRALWGQALGHLVAAGLAGAIAQILQPALGLEHTYWAMVAAVVPLVGHTTRDAVARGIHRVLGTAVGLVVMALVIWAEPPLWALVLIIGLFQFGTEMLVIRNYFWAQVCITPLALIGVSLSRDPTAGLLYDRIVETVIGAVIGIVVVLISSRRVRSALGW